LIPFAGIIGALLLVASDTIGRTLFSPVIIPVGIVVAYIGVPMFVHLIISKKQDYFS
jgi:iron complex transport system permease protein